MAELRQLRSDRARLRELLWAGADEVRSPSEPDCSVRRSLALEIAVARAALVDVQVSMRAVGADAPSSRPRRRGRGWLELADVAPVAAGRELRLLGALHVGRCGRAVPVDVVLAPWSMSRSELRLQLRRRSELPRHYFEVAHRVIDILRDELQRTMAAAPRASAS